MIRTCCLRSWPRQWRENFITKLRAFSLLFIERTLPCDLCARGSWIFANFFKSFFYQRFNIKHQVGLNCLCSPFYDLCWKVEQFIVCLLLLVLGYKSLVLRWSEDLSCTHTKQFIPEINCEDLSRKINSCNYETQAIN